MRGVYKIKNIVNGKIYIGSSKDIDHRWKHHLWKLSSDRHENQHLQRAFNIHGKDSFSFEILECLDADASYEEMLNIEQKWIDSTCCLNRESGYNMQLKANGSEPSDETKEKIRKAHLGMKPTQQTIKKMSIAHMGRKGCLSPMFGKHHSAGTIEKMRKAKIGKTRKPFTKEHRHKLSLAWNNRIAHLGSKRTEQALVNMRAAQQKRWAKIKKEKIETAFLALPGKIS